MTEKAGGWGDLKHRIQEAIKSWKDEIVDFTKTLIAVRTENPPGIFYRECADAITRKLRDIGLECEMIEVPVRAGPGASAPESSGQSRAGSGGVERVPIYNESAGPDVAGHTGSAESPSDPPLTHEEQPGSGTEAPRDSEPRRLRQRLVGRDKEGSTRYCLLPWILI